MIPQITTLGAYGGPVSLYIYGAPYMSILNFSLQLASPVTTIFAPVYPSQRCQMSDQGVSLIVQVVDSSGAVVNLRPATSLQILTIRPSGVKMFTPATLYTNGYDGKMFFLSSAIVPFGTGFGEEGLWQVQGRIVLGGNLQFTTVGAFVVDKNLGA